MATDFLQAAQDAITKLGINTGTQQPAAGTTATISSDLGGLSHQEYAQKLAAADAAKQAAASNTASDTAGVKTAHSPYSGSYSTGPYSTNYAIGSKDDPKKMISVTSKNYNDPWIQQAIRGLAEDLSKTKGQEQYAAGWQSLLNDSSVLSKPYYREKYVSPSEAWRKWNAGEFAPQRTLAPQNTTRTFR